MNFVGNDGGTMKDF